MTKKFDVFGPQDKANAKYFANNGIAVANLVNMKNELVVKYEKLQKLSERLDNLSNCLVCNINISDLENANHDTDISIAKSITERTLSNIIHKINSKFRREYESLMRSFQIENIETEKTHIEIQIQLIDKNIQQIMYRTASKNLK